MIRLVPNANTQLNDMIHDKSVISFYYQTCENYARGYIHTFINSMQILVTKLGIMISKVSDGPSISFCVQSIHYICNDVLDNPTLVDTFNDLGLNKKGNHDKHKIEELHIDMLRCVTAYNNLVNRIADVYGLSALKQMIVRKQIQNKSNGVQRSNSSKQLYKENRFTHITTSRPHETAALVDENIKVRAALEKGEGRYIKGIFNKKTMVNFRLKINIQNENGLKISKVTAFIKGKSGTIEKNIPPIIESTTDFNLPTESFGGNVEASVIVIYKIGLFKAKQIKVTVSKNY